MKKALVLSIALLILFAALTGCSETFEPSDVQGNEAVEESQRTELHVDSVLIIVWKDDNGDARYSLYDGNMNISPSQISTADIVFHEISALNAKLAEYPQDVLEAVNVLHTIDFTKDEMQIIADAITVPSGNYSKAVGLYEFHITTLDEARAIVNEHNPKAAEVAYIGEDSISYTNPPAPVECYIFKVTLANKTVTCAVSKERGIYFTHDGGEWFASSGAGSL